MRTVVSDCAWNLPPTNLALAEDEVHVWCACLDQPTLLVRQLGQILSADEQRRAERFHFQHHRDRFIVGRGVLRRILGRYLNIEPQRLQFNYGPKGKPTLATGCGEGTLRFNLAHSHQLAVYGVTYHREIGVDVEYIRPISEAGQIARRTFSAEEIRVFQTLPDDQKQFAFYSCWTRKEAYIKATGDGLSRPLDGFDVSLVPGQPASLLNVSNDPGEAARWSLRAVTPEPSYTAAMAVEGHSWRLACWQWNERWSWG